MPPIPAAILPYLPALLALAASFAVTALARDKGRRVFLRAGLSLVCLLGWAALEPLGRLASAAVAPPVAPAMLIVPAALVAGVEAVRVWRRGANDRLLSVLAAGLVGWWLARTAAGPAEFWRVAIVTAALTGVVVAICRQRPGRVLAVPLALWGGLAVAGLPGPWLVAVEAAAAACVAPVAMRAPATLPSALVAALLAGADLARGRLPRGHLDPADLACLLALAAPLLTSLFEPRLGKRWLPLAPALGAAAAVALTWGLRRAVL